MNNDHLLLRKTFALALVPVICLQNWVFTFIPSYYLQHWFIYLATGFLFLYWKMGIFRPLSFCRRYWKVFAILGIVAAFQAVSLFISVSEAYGDAFWRSYVVHMAKLFAQFPFIIAILALYDQLARDTEIHRHILYGFIFSLVVLVVICCIQILYILCVMAFSPHVDALANTLRSIIHGVANLLEARWPVTIYDFHGNDSYATHLIRVNGIFEEASALAANIGTFFLPICLGFIFSKKINGKAAFAFCLALIAINIASVSLTGIIIAAAALPLLFIYAHRAGMNMRHIYIIFCTLALIPLALAASTHHRTRFLAAMDNYFGMKSPRPVVTLQSAELAKTHPVMGVGRGMFTFYLEKRIAPMPIADTDPEFIQWRKWGNIPKLSMILGITAEYGAILMLGLLGIAIHTGYRLYRFARLPSAPEAWKMAFHAYLAWCVLAFFASFGSLDFRNAMFNSIFFAAIAFVHNRPLSEIIFDSRENEPLVPAGIYISHQTREGTM